jgi:hypothetical protein
VNLSHDITYHYIARLRHHTDELGMIVQGHLLIEFVLNETIRHSFKQPAKILNDHRAFSFAVKARLIFSAGFLPDHIFQNIQRINSIRNHLAHNLDWKSLKLDYKFSCPTEDEAGSEVKIYDRQTGRAATRRKYVKMLCIGTLVQMRNHFLINMAFIRHQKILIRKVPPSLHISSSVRSKIFVAGLPLKSPAPAGWQVWSSAFRRSGWRTMNLPRECGNPNRLKPELQTSNLVTVAGLV